MSYPLWSDLSTLYVDVDQFGSLKLSDITAGAIAQFAATSKPIIVETGYLQNLYLSSEDIASAVPLGFETTPSYLTLHSFAAYGNNSIASFGAAGSNPVGDSRSGIATVTGIPINGGHRRDSGNAPEVRVIAEWDGYVEEIHIDYFVARMHGLQGLGVVDEEEDAEIPISDVDPGDLDLLVIGGFFRLVIADELPKVGRKKRYTTVQFRRLPAYTKRELDAAKQEADKLVNGFQMEETRRSAGT